MLNYTSYCKEIASFNAAQLNIVLPHLANWTSVLLDSRPSKADSTINITCFPYFKALDDYVATNPQGLFQNISQIVNSDMTKYAEQIQNFTLGNEQSRLGKCQSLLLETFGDVLLHLWLSHRYKPSQAEAAQKITTNIQTMFAKRISENEWLDEASKDVLRRKLKAMKFHIGEGPGFLSLDALIHNHLTSQAMPDIHKIRHFNLTRKGRQSRESISAVNAFNLRDINVVEIAFSLLREPLFTLETPISMQYGSIGFIAGHEIAHGFDNSGILVDQNGTVASNSILLSDSYKKFLERAKCFIDKYSGYSEASMTVNGTLTLPENIADNGGLDSAWQAYQAEKAARGPFQKRTRLPSLSYSEEQMFFISFAQTFCSAKSDVSIRIQILTDDHSPEKTRVNAGLSLFEPFAKTFNCPASSNMNPSKRCRMWKRGVPVS
ncbi:hypothetical protein BKA69DRAFT_1066272 [Paraphysoderma sedebokerense]|nr:hypothetical protein BKA69DRAFT_1066272 [Paraphysoderma sedebokerense]